MIWPIAIYNGHLSFTNVVLVPIGLMSKHISFQRRVDITYMHTLNNK